RRLLVQERRGFDTARERPLFEAEHEDDLVAARARPQEIDDVDPPSSLAASTNRRTFERRDDLVGGKRSAQRKPALELAGKLVERLERPQIFPRLLPDGRRFEPVRRTNREACEVEHGVERRLCLPKQLERRQRMTV